MGTGPSRKKGSSAKKKEFKKSNRTRRRSKDLDQIHEDLRAQTAGIPLPFDADLPGGGQFPCVPCALWMKDDAALQQHARTKNHKKRLRLLKEVPYTVQESEAAAGMGNALIHPNVSSKI